MLTHLVLVQSIAAVVGTSSLSPQLDSRNAEPPAALLIVLAGLPASPDCLVDDASFTTDGGGCLDLATGIVWGRSSHDFAGNPFHASDEWADVVAHCEQLVDGGYDDWYLPTRDQMEQVFANGAVGHLDYAYEVSFEYWSSTVRGGQRAWSFDFKTGTASVFLKTSRFVYACVRDMGAGSPPDAPTSLVATVAGSGNQIDVTWTDSSTNELAFVVERSLDSIDWNAAATLPADATAYGDGGLEFSQTYYYRVVASNAAGTSGPSNVAVATTGSAPSGIADGETAVAGNVAGTFEDTWTDDGTYQSLREERTGGNPANRVSFLEHVWSFDVEAGSTIVLHVQAFRGDTGEGDEFELAWAPANSASFSTLPGTITKTADDGTYDTFALPASAVGAIEIRVRDTNRTPGSSQLDTLYVDHLYVSSD